MINDFLRRRLGLPPQYGKRLSVPQLRRFDQFFRTFEIQDDGLLNTRSMSVDLGCGSRPRNPFCCHDVLGLDLHADSSNNVIACDLSAGLIPLADSVADAVTAFDLIEHIPRYLPGPRGPEFPFVKLMSEVYRLLKPNGLFFSKTPAYPFPEAFMDPTHVNIITEQTFPAYFCSARLGDIPEASRYGFNGRFLMVRQRWWGGAWLLTLLRRPSE